MTATDSRIRQLARASKHPVFARLLGKVDESELSGFLAAELGRADALEVFSTHGDIRSKAVAPGHILHIVSGNTPHAAMQSLLRGLLLGSANTVKLPSGGLPEVTAWIGSLPDDLSRLVTVEPDRENVDWHSADAVIAIGSDDTINSIQSRIQPHQTFIPHGHKVSIGIVSQATEEAAGLAARDVSLYDQRGCLSLHAIYVDESTGASARDFSRLLADAMEEFAGHSPPRPLTLSEAGAVRNLRDTTRYLAANGTATELIESKGSLDWTVIYQDTAALQLSCLGRTVFVKPLPPEPTTDALGPESRHLSTIALHPFDTVAAEKLTRLGAHRICPLGQSQQPSLFWHHDGFAPLASLARWQDIG